jgi:hypothetical protein
MAWYYYSGRIARPIPVKKGLSKSVKPNTRVEILENSKEVAALIRKRELRLTGKPRGAGSVADEPVLNADVRSVVEKSELAMKFAEKGKTGSPGVPPVARGGQEQTHAELNISKVDKVAPPPSDEAVMAPSEEKQSSDGVEEVDQAEELPDDSKKKRKGIRRRRG